MNNADNTIWNKVFIPISAVPEAVRFIPNNFTQIESEPTENGVLSEINTFLRGIYRLNTSSNFLLFPAYI